MKSSMQTTKPVKWIVIGAASAALMSLALLARTQTPPDPVPTIQSLKGKSPAEPQQLSRFVKSKFWAVVLGKALFWDQMAGSDNVTACASCHFNAGADNRTKNQLSPGLNASDSTFQATRTAGGGPNYTLRMLDFPFHVLINPNDRESSIVYQSNDVVSSQGVFQTDHINVVTGSSVPFEFCNPSDDQVFQVHGIRTRRVEPRNTPTVINAAFNFRNFWDGRANNIFNGKTPFGRRDANARIWELNGTSPAQIQIALENASAASQAVGPPGNPFEMSCNGRDMRGVARKLIPLKALSRQVVDPTDSVLGLYRNTSGSGIRYTYRELIQAAFQDNYWKAASVGTQGYSQMEENFSLFWGLAIQLYEATLVSDDSKFDQFVGNGQDSTQPQNPSVFSAQEKLGLSVFTGKGKCVNCHKGPDFTSAGFLLQKEKQEGGLVERMLMGDNKVALYDQGFYNIGVRPAADDIGVGNIDPFGHPLSFTRQFLHHDMPDPFRVEPCTFEVGKCQPVTDPNHRDAVDGAFKVSGLRNIELTGPYFHTGGFATLEQVVEFYNRGGNRRSTSRPCTVGTQRDTTGFDKNCSNLDADIQSLGLTAVEQAALVAFLKTLTDDRVRNEKAPFDHPQLQIPNGHVGNQSSVIVNGSTGNAADSWKIISAMGAGGRPAKGFPPLAPFSPGP